jgi:hypothetical protein
MDGLRFDGKKRLHAAAGCECESECDSSNDFDEAVEHVLNARNQEKLGNQKDDFFGADL